VPHLVGTQGIVAGTRFALTQEIVVIGRDGENEIVIEDSTVSRKHARLERTEKGRYYLVDQESTNGVFLNGVRVVKTILQGGDEVRIGDIYFQYEA